MLKDNLMKYLLLLFWLLSFQYTVASSGNRVTILYFNDAHEISPVQDELGTRGGVARVKTIVDSIRTKNPRTIVVFGGDLAGGTLFGAVYKGFPMVEAFNLLPLHLATFGQHDFDFGTEVTEKLVKSSSFPWISSNLKYTDGRSFANLPVYFIKEFKNMKIGFIGLTDAMNTTTPSGEIIQLPLNTSATSAINKMKVKYPKVDIVVAITQTTRDKNEELLLNESRIDLILSEEQFENRSTAYYVGHRPILSPCGNLGSVIQVDFISNDSTLSIVSSVHPVDQTVPEENELFKLQEKYQNLLEVDLAEPIADVIQPLDGGINGNFKCRWGETNIGNLITDAYRDFYNADIGIINGGGIRANVPEGKLTFKNALSILPFHNRISLIRISGQQFKDLLEHGVASVENRDGAFLQISGASYGYNPKKPSGERISEIKVGDNILDIDKQYTVALPEYILKGGNDFKIPVDAEILVPPQTSTEDIKIFSGYCRKLRILDLYLEHRIKIESE